jgi:transcriptional regulator with XRE-family HTH domain
MSTIRNLRKALGLSQEALAKAIGKSYASVRNYEDGRKLPPDVMGKMLALAARASLPDLMNEIERQAAEWYDRPIEISAPEEFQPPEESPEERRNLHAQLDYILDSAGSGTARALRETIRMYFVAARCLNDPVIDHGDFLGGPLPDHPPEDSSAPGKARKPS